MITLLRHDPYALPSHSRRLFHQLGVGWGSEASNALGAAGCATGWAGACDGDGDVAWGTPRGLFGPCADSPARAAVLDGYAGVVGVDLQTGRVDQESHRVQFIGAGTDNLGRAAEYYDSIAHAASAHCEVVSHLDHQIENARINLEQCLAGHDSFDALAFLRLALGPWDFTGLKESETLIETSLAAQDVVALAFLGMGLPRTKLTGENSGQPDIGAAIAYAAEIVRAANARAMIGGMRIKEPLGRLAGQFLAYELSVRGRQYESVAANLNTALLGDPRVQPILREVLGFTLAEVREVRAAGVALLNERFFGARDRVGDAVQSGVATDAMNNDSFIADMNLMLNECRLFGSVTASDIAARTGIEQTVVFAILDFFSAKRLEQGAKNPILEFVDGKHPLPWGAIADADGYLILTGFLGEDELRRDVERGLISASRLGGGAAKAWTKYDRRRAAFAEARTAERFAALLGGAQPLWVGQKYIGPVEPDDVSRFARDSEPAERVGREYESDVLFVVDGVAFCIEVKAGSVTDKSRKGHALRLATDLEKTLKEGNEQAQRLTELIRTNRGVWGTDGSWISLDQVRELHSTIVMLDDMGPLSLSMNELAEQGVIESDEVPWIVSLHDLHVISLVLEHPAQFLDFVRRRRERKLATMVRGADELDVLMWFVDGGMYFAPDPAVVAEQLPVDTVIRQADKQRFEDQPRVHLGTLTDPLDAWMYGEEGLSRMTAPKPVRVEEGWVEDFLGASETYQTAGWLRFGADLVSLSGSAQQRIGRELKAQCRAARGGDRERSFTTHGTTSVGSWLLTAAAAPSGAEIDHLPRYIDAKQYQTHANRSMLLLYDTDGKLTGTRFRGEPEPRTAERDAEIEVSPLRSLASTFGTVPPSARRKTHRLRGKRSKRRRT